MYSYVRYTPEQTLLFVANFDPDESHDTVLKLPQDFLALQHWPAGESLAAREIFQQNKAYGSFRPADGLKVHLEPNSVLVFEVAPAGKKSGKKPR